MIKLPVGIAPLREVVSIGRPPGRQTGKYQTVCRAIWTHFPVVSLPICEFRSAEGFMRDVEQP